MNPLVGLAILDDVPEWLSGFGVPAGWRFGRYTGSDPGQPWRIAVCGLRSDGGWDACETVTAFSFTGTLAPEMMRHNGERMLRAHDADNISTVALATPAVDGVYAVRSTGHFSASRLRMWGQYTHYVVGSDLPGQRRVVQQCLFVELSRQAALDADIAELSNGLHRAFVTAQQ